MKTSRKNIKVGLTVALALFVRPLTAQDVNVPGNGKLERCVEGISGKDGKKKYVSQYGAIGDGVTDNTNSIRSAIKDLARDETLVFDGGVYIYSDILEIHNDGIKIDGNGSTLKSAKSDRQSIEIYGNNVVLKKINLLGNSEKRLSSRESTNISVYGNSDILLNNTIDGGASGGIFVYGATDFFIKSNNIKNTRADGIHVTGGAKRGVITENYVSNAGDDMIAVVTYYSQPNQASISTEIAVINNTVTEGEWGRGVTVVGGYSIVIDNNNISHIMRAAGVLIAQEKAYHTFGDFNVFISNNTIKNNETDNLPPGVFRTGHGAIEINSQGDWPIDRVFLNKNKISDSRKPYVRAKGRVCMVVSKDNIFDNQVSDDVDVSARNCSDSSDLDFLNKEIEGREDPGKLLQSIEGGLEKTLCGG